MNEVTGFILVYVVPAVFAALFWFLVRRLTRLWVGRDVMVLFRPDRFDVLRAERKLGL